MIDHNDCYRTIGSQKSTSDDLIGIFCRVLLDFFGCIIDTRFIPDKVLHHTNFFKWWDAIESKEYFLSEFHRQDNRIRTAIHNNAMNDMSESRMNNTAEIKSHTDGYKEWQKSQLPLYSSETILCQIVLSLSSSYLSQSSLVDELSTMYSWLVESNSSSISLLWISILVLISPTSRLLSQQRFVRHFVLFPILKNLDWAWKSQHLDTRVKVSISHHHQHLSMLSSQNH